MVCHYDKHYSEVHWSSYYLDYVYCITSSIFNIELLHVSPPTCTFSTPPMVHTHTHARTHAYTHAHVAHTHTHTCTHTHTVRLSSTQPSDTFFEGYLVEARESTSDDFANNTSIWGTWSVNRSDPYHTVNCNRSSTSQEGPFPVSALASFKCSSRNVACTYVVYQTRPSLLSHYILTGERWFS